MGPHDLVLPVGRSRHGCDRQDGGVCGQDRLGLAELVELGEDLLLQVQVLRDGLDDEVGVLHGLRQVCGGFQAAQDGLHLVFRHLSLCDALGEALLDPGGSLLDELRADVVENCIKTCLDGGLGDAVAHGAGPQNGEFFYFHDDDSFLGYSRPRPPGRASGFFRRSPGDDGRRVAPEGWRPVPPSRSSKEDGAKSHFKSGLLPKLLLISS